MKNENGANPTYESIFNLKKSRRDNTFLKKGYDGLIDKVETLRLENMNLKKNEIEEPQKVKRSKADISKVCSQIYNDYREAKADFESGELSQSKYYSYLNVLRLLVDVLPAVDGDALHEWEIIVECIKQGLIDDPTPVPVKKALEAAPLVKTTVKRSIVPKRKDATDLAIEKSLSAILKMANDVKRK